MNTSQQAILHHRQQMGHDSSAALATTVGKYELMGKPCVEHVTVRGLKRHMKVKTF